MKGKSLLVFTFTIALGSFASTSESTRPARVWLAEHAFTLLSPSSEASKGASTSKNQNSFSIESSSSFPLSSSACACPAINSAPYLLSPSSSALGSFYANVLMPMELSTPNVSSLKSALGIPSELLPISRGAPAVLSPSAPLPMGPSIASIHGGERGGGDQVAAEFLAAAQAFLRDLAQLHVKSKFQEIDEKRVSRAISDFRIDVYDTPILDSAGVPRGAVTDLSKKTIEISRPLWTATGTLRLTRWSLVVHEILRASGYFQEDDLYAWTQPLIASLQNDLPYSHLLSLSSSNIETVLFQKQLAGRGIKCEWIAGENSLKKDLLFRDTSYGIEIVLRSGQGNEKVFSETHQNILQVSYGPSYTTFGLRVEENYARVLLIQTPALGAESVTGMHYTHKLNKTFGNTPVAILCDIEPKK